MEIKTNLTDKAKRDYLLVTKAQNGNQQAFTELLDYYKDSIYYMIFKIIRNETDAEDLTIEAFSKAFKNIEFYTPTYAFSTWLFKIASNNAIDFLRKKKTAKVTVSIDNEYETDNNKYTPISLVADSPDPEEKLISSQTKKNLHKIIDKLPADYSIIVNLRFIQELSYAKIAEELKIPLGTVKARIHRSRDLLAEVLNENF